MKRKRKGKKDRWIERKIDRKKEIKGKKERKTDREKEIKGKKGKKERN